MFRKLCCFCRIKGKKSESNSQPLLRALPYGISCFCRIKGKKSESNSQPSDRLGDVLHVVSAVSKVRNLKAIHNMWSSRESDPVVVSAVSKVRNLKAIHNRTATYFPSISVVSAVSKVRNLKAIHNQGFVYFLAEKLFLPYQR